MGTDTNTTCVACGNTLAPDNLFELCGACQVSDVLKPNAESLVVTIAGYEIQEQINEGGMGVVYRARQPTMNRFVALKMIRSEKQPTRAEIERFRIEVEAAAALDHPNITPIYSFGEDDGIPYFVMKLFEDGSLKERLTDFALIPPTTDASQNRTEVLRQQEKLARLIAQTAHAVHHAHQRGILHRDLKPSNIMIDEGDQPVLTDFGLAKREDYDSQLTLSGVMIGTPAYMAPEVAVEGFSSAGTAADIYSLGAVLYQLLTGRPPFAGDTLLELVQQVTTTEPDHPSTYHPLIDRDLAIIGLKCLEKDPAHRYESAAALAEDLERWLHHQPILARSVSRTERLLRWSKRNPILSLLTAACLGILGVGSLGIISQWKRAIRAESFASQRAESLARQNFLLELDRFLEDRAFAWACYFFEKHITSALNQVTRH